MASSTRSRASRARSRREKLDADAGLVAGGTWMRVLALASGSTFERCGPSSARASAVVQEHVERFARVPGAHWPRWAWASGSIST
jgi:hypothetical protein